MININVTEALKCRTQSIRLNKVAGTKKMGLIQKAKSENEQMKKKIEYLNPNYKIEELDHKSHMALRYLQTT